MTVSKRKTARRLLPRRCAAIAGAFGVAAILVLGFSESARAIPTPADFNDDTGVELFTPLFDPFGALEIFDALGTAGASEFGFYFNGSPDDKITIFDTLDQTFPQNALISFSSGLVVDLDEGVTQSTFTPAPANSVIGFYLTLFPGTTGALTGFTEAALNPGGTDFVQAFRSEFEPPTWFLNFEDFSTSTVLAQYIVSPVAAAVPEPPTIALIGMAILGLFSVRRQGALRL